jgi:aryl carrier-like protein
VQENFFEAGGNSLLLIRLRAKLGRSLGRKISTVALFDHPTIRQQAQFLAAEPGAGPDPARRPGPAQESPEPGTGRPARSRQALRQRSVRRTGEPKR